MRNDPIEVFNLFRKSMLDKTETWKDLISDDVLLVGPLAQVKGKKSFIEVNQPFFDSIRGSELIKIIEQDNFIITQITTDVATPSGKIITLDICEWYEIKDYRIIALKVYFDATEFIGEIKSA